MRLLLEIVSFCLLNLTIIAGLIRIRGLLEGEPYSRIYGTTQFRVSSPFQSRSQAVVCVSGYFLVVYKPIVDFPKAI